MCFFVDVWVGGVDVVYVCIDVIVFGIEGGGKGYSGCVRFVMF